MRRQLLMAGPLGAGVALLLAAECCCAVPGAPCATQTYATYDFTDWPLAGFRDVREERFPTLGRWLVTRDGITAHIPDGVDEKDLVAMKDGVGMASSIIDGLMLGDLTAIAEMSFQRKGAPSILLRAQVGGEITGQMLSLVIYERGINLWRFDGSKWHKAAAAQFPVEPGVYHRVKVRLEGPRAVVWVDGKRVMRADDVGLNAPGAVGIWAGEGPCYFRTLRLRHETP